MAVLALGISHRRADVELLERLAFADDDLAKSYRRASDDPAIDGAVFVSTCNRVEVYGSVPSYHVGFQALKRLLCESRGVEPELLAEPLYSHYEADAAEHLFARGERPRLDGARRAADPVAGPRGAQARGVGERDERRAHWPSSTRPRARAAASEPRPGIGAAPDAFVDAGADLADEALGGLEGRSAVVVGAGQMSSLAVKHLRDRRVGTVRMLNRSLERARALAERTQAEPGRLDELPRALRDADLLVSATGADGRGRDRADAAGCARGS